MNPTRVWAIAHNVFRETIRDRVLYLILLFAIVMVGAVLFIPTVANGAEDKIILDLGLAGINVIGLIVAVFVGTGLVNKEIDKRTIYLLVAKPIARAELVVGKHFGMAAVLSVLLTAMTALFFGLAVLQQGAALPWGALVLSVIFMFLELMVIVAAALMFGVFTSSILATIYTIAFYIIGHLADDLRKLGEIAQNPALGKLMNAIYLVLPDLEQLNLKNGAVYNQLPALIDMSRGAAWGLAYTGLLLCIATFVFSRRQF
ncbi:MAG: ABC transporter permease subunit [Cyanobacteria bacterium J06639_1]